jgi:hypothetical protein
MGWQSLNYVNEDAWGKADDYSVFHTSWTGRW